MEEGLSPARWKYSLSAPGAQWKALVAYTTKKATPPPQPPTLREAIRMMAMTP